MLKLWVVFHLGTVKDVVKKEKIPPTLLYYIWLLVIRSCAWPARPSRSPADDGEKAGGLQFCIIGQHLTLPRLNTSGKQGAWLKTASPLIVSIDRDCMPLLIGGANATGHGGLDPMFLGISCRGLVLRRSWLLP